ncbi:MAG TPA: glycosyltransferase family 2 protein, partial [Acidobacteriota bacterium]|nr:glycosyltransferase family 2 protein [Acidobacteriota bacterium]
IWRLFGHRYSDLGPFRAIRFPALQSLAMSDPTYGWTVEMQLKAVRQKLRIQEVPVSYRKRIGTSKISGTLMGSIKAGTKIIWTIFKYGIA